MHRHDLNKVLLAKPAFVRDPLEMLGPLNMYRDVERNIYETKVREFEAKMREYAETNRTALTHRRPKFGARSGVLLSEADFEQRAQDMATFQDSLKTNKESEPYENRPERKIIIRSVRHYHKVVDTGHTEIPNDMWFVRYLTLCKFIDAARRVIIRNRLTRRLAKLKQQTKSNIERYEAMGWAYEESPFNHLFEKFIVY